MDMTGEQRIAASREEVWRALNDPEILRQAIPGAESVERISDTEFQATVTAKIGPVKATFKGKVELTDIDPPNGYTITGDGKGGAVGFAKGGAKVRLTEDGGETILAYEVTASVGGKLAQIGSRLVDGAAKKMAGEFFDKFTEIVAGASAEAAPEAASEVAPAAEVAPVKPAATPAPSGGIPQWAWIAGLIVIVILVLLLFSGGD